MKYLITLCLIPLACGCKHRPTMTNAEIKVSILDNPIVIDQGDYLEVRCKHVAVFTEKPFPSDMISGSSANGQNAINPTK